MKQSSSFTSRLYCACFSVAVFGLACLQARASEASGAAKLANERTVQSQELMRQGATRFAEGDWQAAYLAYRKAWEINPHPAVAANMAATEIKLGLYLPAAAHLKYALSHLPPVQMHKRDAVEQQLDEVRAHLVAVTLSADLEGVEISIDGKPIGRTPLLEEILLEPGHHAVRAEFADITQNKAIDVQAGAVVKLLFDLSATETTSRPSATSPDPPQPFVADARRDRTRTWVLIGSTAATAISLGIGVAMGIQAHEENQDAQTLRAQINGTSPTGNVVTGETCPRRDQSDACDLLYRNVQAIERDRAISTGAFVAAGVLGVATVATALLWPPQQKTAQSRAFSSNQLHVGTWMVPKGYGLSALLRF